MYDPIDLHLSPSSASRLGAERAAAKAIELRHAAQRPSVEPLWDLRTEARFGQLVRVTVPLAGSDPGERFAVDVAALLSSRWHRREGIVPTAEVRGVSAHLRREPLHRPSLVIDIATDCVPEGETLSSPAMVRDLRRALRDLRLGVAGQRNWNPAGAIAEYALTAAGSPAG